MLRQFASSAVRSFGGAKTYATEAVGGQLLVHMGGVFAGEVDQVFSKAHKAICGTGGEIKEANFTVKWRRGIVGEMTEFLNKNGVTVTDLDQYRAGPDVVLEGFAHLPTGLAEFPQVKESDLLEKLKSMGVQVVEFDKVTGQDPPAPPAAAAKAKA